MEFPLVDSFPPSRATKPAPRDVMPSPPIWRSRAITTCPNIEYAAPVSTVISPVTQTADTVEKSASRKPTSHFPL